MPIPVTNISDSHHPVKIGMSDAYLFHHSVHNPLAPISQPRKLFYFFAHWTAVLLNNIVENVFSRIRIPLIFFFAASIKRVIYEYHRIEVKPSLIVSNTIVLLKAQPSKNNFYIFSFAFIENLQVACFSVYTVSDLWRMFQFNFKTF